MFKRAFASVIGVVGFCLLATAQSPGNSRVQVDEETITPEQLSITGEVDVAPALSLYRSDLFRTIDGTVLIHGLPVLTLLDGRRFPISSELGGMGMRPLDIFPVAFLSAVNVQKTGSSLRYGSDAPGGTVDLRLNRIYSGGEVGFFYGKSGGKYGREDWESYVIGGVGNDKVHITAGVAYGDSSGRGVRVNR